MKIIIATRYRSKTDSGIETKIFMIDQMIEAELWISVDDKGRGQAAIYEVPINNQTKFVEFLNAHFGYEEPVKSSKKEKKDKTGD